MPGVSDVPVASTPTVPWLMSVSMPMPPTPLSDR